MHISHMIPICWLLSPTLDLPFKCYQLLIAAMYRLKKCRKCHGDVESEYQHLMDREQNVRPQFANTHAIAIHVGCYVSTIQQRVVQFGTLYKHDKWG